MIEAPTRTRYARVAIGTAGITSRVIKLDKGVGPAKFQKLCNHPQQWFTDVDGRRIRATAIVTFEILTEAEALR